MCLFCAHCTASKCAGARCCTASRCIDLRLLIQWSVHVARLHGGNEKSRTCVCVYVFNPSYICTWGPGNETTRRSEHVRHHGVFIMPSRIASYHAVFGRCRCRRRLRHRRVVSMLRTVHIWILHCRFIDLKVRALRARSALRRGLLMKTTCGAMSHVILCMLKVLRMSFTGCVAMRARFSRVSLILPTDRFQWDSAWLTRHVDWHI